MKNLIQSVFCVVLLLFFACRKEDFPGDGSKLKMTIGHLAWSDDSTVYTIFKYDASEKLTMIIDSFKNEAATTIQLFYDNAGRLAYSVTRFPYFTDEKLDSFYYDNNDRIIRKRTVSDDPAYSYFSEFLLTYDAAGRLIADTTHTGGYNHHDFNSYNSYQYDANDDLVKWESASTYQGILHSYQPVQASYNNNINPYRKLGLMFYLLTQDNVVLSAHERTSVNWTPANQTTYHYDYFQNGLVKRITINNYRSPSTITLVDFVYE